MEKRLEYLYKGESFAIVMFVFLSYVVNKVYPELHLYSLLSFWMSFFLLEFLLLQGAAYWCAKLNMLKRKNSSETPVHIVRKLKSLEKFTIGLFIVSLVLFVIDLLRFYPTLPEGGLLIAACIYVFAFLEYINYFYVQLSYDNLSDISYLLKSRRLKQSCISKDYRRLTRMKK
ncbi:general stress protein [Peribacillus psychrosaccharolyticus]|uniref:General stress protein n=1 Tax=Peribacillus psychrosaccharolyticus TaxID=1407 RepID=A0A974NN68_PERPY|nr:general stress protein [Peribacillus psychrosaccharolyticus]MEC2055978.1 general stress protein [Peribacillus psychrosaccharolyticus]MED3743152.1 general stress protein [Peribacillus psychrosaccharolyticus]QQT00811.1 general stress protein [Peribacillus psychrosaccharolyticus]